MYIDCMILSRLIRVVRVLLCAFFVIFGGCASSAKKVSVAAAPASVASATEANEVTVVAAEEVDPTAPEVITDDSTGIDITTDIDELLRIARQACADSAYAVADSILRKASAFLMLNSELPDSGSDWFPLQDYVADIISMYTDLFPAGFSAPEEISSMIFSRHLLESLMDSLKVSPQDSAFLARLSNKRGVTYDIPVVWNDRVKRALLFYMKTRKGIFDRWLYRAGYYLPVMKQMFADSGLPRDLAHLPIIESGFNPHAYSRAHAAGIWQFIPSTGKAYGLRQNYWIDERRDPIKSTGGAIRYLGKLYGDFNNWHTALASYNCGENGMARAINKAGGVNDYWALSLPKETMNYVPLFLAAMIIAKNPDVFDFEFPDRGVFDPDTVLVNDCVEMKTIADGLDVSLDTLITMNPHILHWCTPPDMRDVRLYLPKGYAGKFKTFYDSLPDAKKTKYYRYTVKSGDNLSQIARNFRVSVDALREINNMKPNSIAVGKYVIIPIPVNESVPTHLASSLNTVERERVGRRGRGRGRGRASGGGSGGSQRQSGVVTSRTGKKITYKVRTGETLYSISNTFNVSVKDLLEWNYLASPRSLKAEQTLVIYQQGGAPPSQSTDDDETPPPSANGAPAQTAKAVATAPSRQVKGNATQHSGKRLVKQGETLYGIATELGIPVSELAAINGLDAKRPQLFPGDVLVYTPRPASEAGANRANAGGATAPTSQPQASTQGSGAGQVVMYKVKNGDNLWRIALSFGVTVDVIRESNNLTTDSVIMPGDVLKIIK